MDMKKIDSEKRLSNLLVSLPSTKARKNLRFIMGYQIPTDIILEVLEDTAQGMKMKNLVDALTVENDYMLGKMIAIRESRKAA